MEQYLLDIIETAKELGVDILELTRDDYTERGTYSPYSFYRIMDGMGISKPGFFTAKRMAYELSESESDIDTIDIGQSVSKKMISNWTEKAVKEALVVLEKIEKSISPKKKISYPEEPGVVRVLHLGDTHSGKETIDEFGQVIYDHEVMKRRLEYVFLEFIKTCENEEYLVEIIILMTGDMIDGEGVYLGQAHSQSIGSIPEQVDFLARVLWDLIADLRERFPKVKIRVAAVQGNHGISQVNPHSNWDIVVYNTLHILAEKTQKDIDFEYTRKDFTNIKIQNWKYHLRHKVPIQSETSGGAVKFGNWFVDHEYDAVCTGHFHNTSILNFHGKPILRCGATGGVDDFSDTIAKGAPAEQSMWTVTPKRLFKNFTPIPLDEVL